MNERPREVAPDAARMNLRESIGIALGGDSREQAALVPDAARHHHRRHLGDRGAVVRRGPQPLRLGQAAERRLERVLGRQVRLHHEPGGLGGRAATPRHHARRRRGAAASVPHAVMVVAGSGRSTRVRYRDQDVRRTCRSTAAAPATRWSTTSPSPRPAPERARRPAPALVCVIGPEVADELFPGMDPIGQEIRVGAQTLRVVGVTAARARCSARARTAS